MADTIRVTINGTGPQGPQGIQGIQGVAGTGGGGGAAVVQPTEPLTAVAGDMWYKSDTDDLFIYNENIGMWQEIPFTTDFSDPEGTLIIEGGSF